MSSEITTALLHGIVGGVLAIVLYRWILEPFHKRKAEQREQELKKIELLHEFREIVRTLYGYLYGVYHSC